MINDANIIPIGRVPTYTRAIKIGNRVFPLAVYTNTSGGTSFYKCASVDTSTKTWTGNKAVLTNGVYSFEETITEGLSYSSVTPKVGAVYSSDALGEVKLWTGAGNIPAGVPTDGLLAWYPLTVNANDAFGGRSDSIINGNVDFSKGYATGFSTSNYIQLPGGIIPNGQNEWTVGFVIKKPERTWCHDLAEVKGSNEGVAFNDQSGWYHIQYQNSEWTAVNEQPFDKWLLMLIANKPSTGYMVVYTNGSETRATDSREISINNPITVGVLNRNGNIENATPSVTQIKHIFFYGKALSSDEVSSMYQAMSNAGEFNESSGEPDTGDKEYELTVSDATGEHAGANGNYWRIDPPANMWSGYNTTDYGVWTNGTYYIAYCPQYWMGWTIVNNIELDPSSGTDIRAAYVMAAEAPAGSTPVISGWDGVTVTLYSGNKEYKYTVSGFTDGKSAANGDYWQIEPVGINSVYRTDLGVYTNGTYYLAYCNNYWTGWCMVTDITVDPAPMDGSDALISPGPGGDSPAGTWAMFGATVADYAG